MGKNILAKPPASVNAHILNFFSYIDCKNAGLDKPLCVMRDELFNDV
jgi:hypothetical protein